RRRGPPDHRPHGHRHPRSLPRPQRQRRLMANYELQRSEPIKLQHSRFVIPIVSLGIFLAALDQTVVVTALWPISTDLQIPVTELDKAAWVVTAYLLGYTVALPIMGRVADVYGHRRIYLLSLGLFMLGSLLCALAPA